MLDCGQSAVLRNPHTDFIFPGISWKSWNTNQRLSPMTSIPLPYCAGTPMLEPYKLRSRGLEAIRIAFPAIRIPLSCPMMK